MLLYARQPYAAATTCRVAPRRGPLRRGELETEQAHLGWVDNVLWHHGCHTIDGIMGILGPNQARDLSAHSRPAWPSLGISLDVSLQWRATSPISRDEAQVQMSLSHGANWGLHDCHVIGLEDDLLAPPGMLRSRDGVIVDSSEPWSRICSQDAEFVAAVREGRAPALDVDTVLPTVRILKAAWNVWLGRQDSRTENKARPRRP